MEKRLTKKIENHQIEFKDNIKKWLKERDLLVVKENLNDGNEDDTSEFLKYIYDYQNLILSKDDFQKRKRVKNVVPHFERCTAKRANGEQCTRRKKTSECFCGTHVKGTPHGIITDEEPVITTKKIELSAIDIKGIVYYLDNTENVYDTEDVISNNKNPRIIAKYTKIGDEYSIPSLFEDDNN